MKQEIKEHIKYSIIISLVLYLLTSFIKWDILWINEIPNYEQPIRVFIAAFYLTSQLFIVLLLWDKYKNIK